MLKKTSQTMSFPDFSNSVGLISANPKDRLPPNVRADVLSDSNINEKDKIFFDVHAHSFTLNHVPKKFNKILGWLKLARRKKIREWLSKTLQLPFLSNLSKEVMDELVNIYDHFFMKNNITPHLFIVNLMMDMERGIGGGIRKDFDAQLRELTHIRTLSHTCNSSGASGKTYDYKQVILPFLAVDPHNPQIYKQFISAFTPGVNYTDNEIFDADELFFGIKVYPSLGYMPYDPVLMKILRICEAKKIPVTTHCGGIRTRANHRKFELGDFRKENNGQYKAHPIHSKQEFKNIFLYPNHWKIVLDELPDLKLNLAHIGDEDEWKLYVKGDRKSSNSVVQTLGLIRNYKNVYADISYTMYNTDYQKAILKLMKNKNYKSKILNGSDYFLVNLEKGELGDFVQNLKTTFDSYPALWHNLTAKNPYRFLFG